MTDKQAEQYKIAQGLISNALFFMDKAMIDPGRASVGMLQQVHYHLHNAKIIVDQQLKLLPP